MTDYVELPDLAVARGRVVYADTVAILAAIELGIPRPRVRWFRHSAAPDGWAWRSWTDDRCLIGLTGSDDPTEVWVADGLSPSALVRTTAHEVHHAWWLHRFGVGWRSQRETDHMESAAERFALDFASTFH